MESSYVPITFTTETLVKVLFNARELCSTHVRVLQLQWNVFHSIQLLFSRLD